MLLLVDRSPPPTFAPTVFPLDIEGLPAALVNAGSSTLPVTVVEYTQRDRQHRRGRAHPGRGCDDHGRRRPGRHGRRRPRRRARWPLASGPVRLRATKPGAAPSATETVAFVTKGVPPNVQPSATPRPLRPDRHAGRLHGQAGLHHRPARAQGQLRRRLRRQERQAAPRQARGRQVLVLLRQDGDVPAHEVRHREVLRDRRSGRLDLPAARASSARAATCSTRWRSTARATARRWRAGPRGWCSRVR